MKKRFVGFVAAILICALLLCGCGKGAVPSGHLRINGKDIETDWVLKVDGQEISADEYRYFFMNVVYEYTGGAEGYEWTDEENETVLGNTLEYVVLNKALFDLAEDYGLQIDETDEANIQETISEMISEFESEEEYLEALASNYISEEYHPVLLRSTFIQQKLSEFLTGEDGLFAVSEDEMLRRIREEYVCVRYLMLSFDEEGSTENRDKIASYASAITDADSLITHINIYSEDVSMKNNSDGTYLSEEMSDPILFEACEKLDIGEISPVIEGEEGYYIAIRQPIDTDYVTENVDSFISVYQEHMVKELLSEESGDSVIEYNDAIYEKIDVRTME